MRKNVLLIAAALLGFAPALVHAATDAIAPVGTTAPAMSAAPGALTDAQSAAVRDIIKTYLVKEHPEVLVDAMQELQHRDQATAQAKTEEAIKTSADKVYNDPNTPVGGNPKGDVTVVEFFDYNCGYCKLTQPEVDKLLEKDKNVKFIYKDFPILGPMSTESGKAALAVYKGQGLASYVKFHDALFAFKDHLQSDDEIYDIAKKAGVDVEKMKKDMATDAVAAQIKANQQLGQDVGVRGTPMFIIGDNVFPGALQYEQLKKAVDDARVAKK